MRGDCSQWTLRYGNHRDTESTEDVQRMSGQNLQCLDGASNDGARLPRSRWERAAAIETGIVAPTVPRFLRT